MPSIRHAAITGHTCRRRRWSSIAARAYQAAEASILNETESYLNIDGYLYGVVSLKELPDATFPGMLQNFSTLGFPIVVSGQVVIPDQVKVLKSYKKRLQKMTAAQKDANGNFKSNPEAEVAQAQLMQVQRDIISSSLKTAKLSLSVVVRTSHPAVTMRDLEQSERELANRTQEVLNAFTHMNGAKAVAETIAKRRIFLGTLPGLGEADKRDQDMLTSNVADLVPVEMPWMGTRRSPLILFETPFRQLIPFSMFDPDLSDANGLLMAKSGGGKTLAAQQMLLMAARANPLISILERGDSYQPLVELMGGEMIEMSLDSDQTINPWDLPKGEDRPSNDQISFLEKPDPAHAGREHAARSGHRPARQRPARSHRINLQALQREDLESDSVVWRLGGGTGSLAGPGPQPEDQRNGPDGLYQVAGLGG